LNSEYFNEQELSHYSNDFNSRLVEQLSQLFIEAIIYLD